MSNNSLTKDPFFMGKKMQVSHRQKIYSKNKYQYVSPSCEAMFTHGKGLYIFDIAGKPYLDCAAGTFNLSLGYGHEEVIEAVINQAKRLVHASSSFSNDVIAQLSEKLIHLAPTGLSRAHLKVSGGSTANEIAFKMAQHKSKKSDIISYFRGHHGQTFFTTSVSGLAFRRQPFPAASGIAVHVPPPYCYRCFYGHKIGSCDFMCINRIDDFIEFASSGNIAAFIIEPIMGNGDNITPPPGYLSKLSSFCRERNISLIFDEVQTGIGRTGAMFAAEYFDVTPDIITLAKGLGGCGFQLGAILCKEDYVGLGSEHTSFTHGGNILASAAALKTLNIIEKPDFLANVRLVGSYILERLKNFQEKYPFIGDVRGVGLMLAFEVVDKHGRQDVATTKRIIEQGFNNGLLLRSSRYGRGNCVKIRPSLIITKNEAIEVCDRLDKTLNDVSEHILTGNI